MPKKPRTRPGDLWALGPHRLLCADAQEAASWEALLGGLVADLLWTDPPYGVGYVGKTAEALSLQNDYDGNGPLVRSTLEAATSGLIPGAPFYCAAPAGPRSVEFREAITAAGWRLHQELVWVKDVFVLGHSDYHYQHEPLLYGYAPGKGRPGRGRHAGTRWYGDHSQSSVFLVDRPKASREHPTMKPTELIARCMENSAKRAGLVLDPFVGSGSTIIAAEETGRRCYAMDIDPAYVDVAVTRWEEFTEAKAERI